MTDIYNELGILNKKQLNYFCYGKSRYTKFKIKQKNGKVRTIISPCKGLKITQNKILKKIIYPFNDKLSNSCTGFFPGKSIIDNARTHVGKKIILNLDIANFFPSITREQVYYLFFKKFNLSVSDSSIISRMCTSSNVLPQGAPTSPMIANHIASNIDKRICAMLESLEGIDFSYSRYADDITIGFIKSLNFHSIINIISEIIEDEGFTLNANKTKILGNGQRKEITGLIINNGVVALGRKKIKLYRAIFHDIETNGWKKAKNKYNMKTNKYIDLHMFKLKLHGWLCFIKDIHPNIYDKYILFFT